MKYDMWQTEREAAQTLDHGIRLLTTDNPPSAKLWNPKATKPSANYRFRSIQQREAFILKFVEKYDQHVACKVETIKRRHADVLLHVDDVQIGHIFRYSWGYDQTNIQYFQVIAKHGQNVTVHEIAQSVVPDSQGFMSEQVEPRIGHFIDNERPMVKRLQFLDSGKAYLSFPYGWCELWRGGSSYASHYA